MPRTSLEAKVVSASLCLYSIFANKPKERSIFSAVSECIDKTIPSDVVAATREMKGVGAF